MLQIRQQQTQHMFQLMGSDVKLAQSCSCSLRQHDTAHGQLQVHPLVSSQLVHLVIGALTTAMLASPYNLQCVVTATAQHQQSTVTTDGHVLDGQRPLPPAGHKHQCEGVIGP